MKRSDIHFQKNRPGKVKSVVVLWVMFVSTLMGVFSVQAAVQVSASLNATQFPSDRSAVLTITVTGSRSMEPQIPDVEGLQFYARGQSSQFEMINGSFSSSVSSVYQVQASRIGQFTIPAIAIHTSDGMFKTEPISFQVTGSGAEPSVASSQGSSPTARLRSGEGDKVAFMRITPSKEKSYSGEIIPVQIKVYFREGIQANLNSLPQLNGEGFVLQQLEREPVQTQEVINNTRYSVLTWNSALSGIKEGKHTVSMELEATLLVREQRRASRSNSIFNDPFFGNFFDSSYSEKQVTVATPEFNLTVLSLPEDGRPRDFSGAIGDFSLHVTAVPEEVEPGEPITLTMTVSGQGNFDRVQAPQLTTEDGWKTYTPSSEFLKDGGGPGRGKKVFEQALVAKGKDIVEIPSVQFSYFDPRAGVYKTVSSSPIPFAVKGASVPAAAKDEVLQEKTVAEEAAVTPAPVVREEEAIYPNLAPLHLKEGTLEQKMVPLFARVWFQGFVAFLLLGLIVLLLRKFQAARYANNPRLQREQAMKHLLTVREKEIEAALASDDGRRFLANCRTAIQEQFGLLWETEARAITLADLRQHLTVDSPLLTIFSAAEQSAYSGQELSKKQMQEFAKSLKHELEGLL